MKWSVIVFLMCLARLANGSALRCTSNANSEDSLHDTRIEDSEKDAHSIQSDPDKNPDDSIDLNLASKSAMDTSRKIVCVANRMFVRDCNTCWCNEDGTSFFCTRKVCVPELPDEVGGDEKPEELRIIKRECRPDEVFELDCNMCRCNPDGKSYSCTRRACVDPIDEDIIIKNSSSARKKRSNQEELKTCQPGLEFRMDCNKCLCDNDGKTFSCTRLDCSVNNGGTPQDNEDSDASGRALSEDEDSASPPPKLTRETRSVVMNDSTSVHSKSRMAYAGNHLKELPKTCQPGQEFQMDCNTCLCDNEGQDFSCTRTDCEALNKGLRTKRDTSERVNMSCNPGSVFNKDCNVCKCADEGGYAICTIKRCSIEKPEQEASTAIPQTDPDYRCNPGEQFNRDCNDCSCAADGKSVYCTVRFCDKDYSPPAA